MTPETVVAVVLFTAWASSVGLVVLLLKRSVVKTQDRSGAILNLEDTLSDNAPRRSPRSKVIKLRRALERAQEAEFLSKERELRTPRDEDDLKRLARKIDELQASLKEATAMEHQKSSLTIEKVLKLSDSSSARGAIFEMERRVLGKELAAEVYREPGDASQLSQKASMSSKEGTQVAGFERADADDYAIAGELKSHLSPDLANHIRLSSELELALLQENHLENMLAGKVSTRKPRKKRKKKTESESIHIDKPALQARIEGKREEINNLRQQLASIDERLKLEELEEEKKQEKIRFAHPLREAVIDSGSLELNSVRGNQTSEEVSAQTSHNLRGQAWDLKIKRDLEEAKARAEFRADRELKVFAARAKAIREIEAKRKRAAQMHALEDFLCAAVAPISDFAKRLQRLSYDLDPRLESAHRRMTEKFASATQALGESQAMESIIETRLQKLRNALDDLVDGGAEEKPLETDIMDQIFEKSAVESELDGLKTQLSMHKNSTKLFRDGLEARIKTTESELRQLKLRNLFSEDHLSRSEAVVVRLSVLKELLEILPDSKLEKQNRLDFVRVVDAVFEFLNGAPRAEREPPSAFLQLLQTLEERLLRQYIRLAKSEVTPMSAQELARAKKAGEAALSNFESLKLSEKERQTVWEEVREKVEAEGKDFSVEIANLRIDQSMRIIKTIELSTDAVSVLLNSFAATTKA